MAREDSKPRMEDEKYQELRGKLSMLNDENLRLLKDKAVLKAHINIFKKEVQAQ